MVHGIDTTFGIEPAGVRLLKDKEPANVIPHMDTAIDVLIERLQAERGTICALAIHRAETIGKQNYSGEAFTRHNDIETLEELADAAFYTACDLYQDNQR